MTLKVLPSVVMMKLSLQLGLSRRDEIGAVFDLYKKEPYRLELKRTAGEPWMYVEVTDLPGVLLRPEGFLARLFKLIAVPLPDGMNETAILTSSCRLPPENTGFCLDEQGQCQFGQGLADKVVEIHIPQPDGRLTMKRRDAQRATWEMDWRMVRQPLEGLLIPEGTYRRLLEAHVTVVQERRVLPLLTECP